MPDKAAQKVVSITIRRERLFLPKVIAATGFKIRHDKTSGLIDLLVEVAGQKGERIIFDPVITRSNLESLKQFVAGSPINPDDLAQKEEVLVGEEASFANIIQSSRMENRGETIFALFSLYDWVEAGRQTSGTAEIKCIDKVVLMSSAAFQKKLILEIVLMVSQLPKP
jgi:hypothetical protein